MDTAHFRQDGGLRNRAESALNDQHPIETRWLGDSLRAALAETRLYLRTVGAVSTRPARFAAAWLREEALAVNPLGYFATSVSLMALVTALAVRVLRLGGDSGSLLGELLDAAGPYFHYAALGLLTHGLLRLGGSPRRLLGSLAISLYVGGGPATLVTIFNLAMFGVAKLGLRQTELSGPMLLRPAALALATAAYASRIYMFVAFIRALAGLHGIKARWVALAFAVALAATGLFFGLVNPPGHYGLRLLIGATLRGHRVWFPSWSGL
jgi:hypothetical protein